MVTLERPEIGLDWKNRNLSCAVTYILLALPPLWGYICSFGKRKKLFVPLR